MTPWDENRIEILHCQNGTNIDFKMNLGSNVLKDWALFMLWHGAESRTLLDICVGSECIPGFIVTQRMRKGLDSKNF